MGRTKLRGELGLIRLRGTGSPIRLAVSRCQLLTVSCPFIQDRLQGFRNFCSLLKRDHFTLSSGVHPFFLCLRRLCRRGVANRRSGAEGGHPVYEYGPNTWGTSEVDQKVSHTRAESRRNRLIRIGDVFMKIEIFADADSLTWQAATLIAAEAPTAVAERDRFIIAVMA